jgi:transaldolase
VEDIKAGGEDVDIIQYIKDILKMAEGVPVSLEVIGATYDEMVEEGIKLFKMFNPVARNVYIKIPINPATGESSKNDFDGLKAIKSLSDEKIPINCTLIFTPEQSLLAAKAGASFVSPFAGRIDDYIRSLNNIDYNKPDYFPFYGLEKDGDILEDDGIISGVDLVAQTREIFDNYDITDTKVLAASIRNPQQVREVALAGADIATLPFSVLEKLLMHDKTKEGMKSFIKDVVPEYEQIFKE